MKTQLQPDQSKPQIQPYKKFQYPLSRTPNLLGSYGLHCSPLPNSATHSMHSISEAQTCSRVHLWLSKWSSHGPGYFSILSWNQGSPQLTASSGPRSFYMVPSLSFSLRSFPILIFYNKGGCTFTTCLSLPLTVSSLTWFPLIIHTLKHSGRFLHSTKFGWQHNRQPLQLLPSSFCMLTPNAHFLDTLW